MSNLKHIRVAPFASLRIFLVSRANAKNGIHWCCSLFKVNGDCNNYTAKHNIELN